MRLISLTAIFLALTVTPALAEPFQGCFTAESDCAATRSIRNAETDAAVKLEPGQSYTIRARNKPDASHYQLRIPGAKPADRWVAASCGSVAPGPCQGAAVSPPHAATHQPASMLLAVSWQPAFCESQPDKPECTSLNAQRFDANHFALHGLWPQPRGLEYCGVSEDVTNAARGRAWDQLPPLAITPESQAALWKIMPGSQSSLDRYEWQKHGTCAGMNQQAYVDASLNLMNQLNASPVQALFAGAIGKSLSIEQIRVSFDQAFGPGAGARVAVSCRQQDGRNLITELRLNVSTPVKPDSKLADLLASAPPAKGRMCDRGEIDAASP